MATPVVCSHFKFGFCKFRENYRKQHVKEVCDKSECEIRTCKFRHPRKCKFYDEYRRCMFDPCAFLHINTENNIENLKSENIAIKEKLKELENDLREVNEKEHETLNLIEKLKLVDFENIHTLEKELFAKDSVIKGQQQQIIELEDRIVIVENILGKQKKEVPAKKSFKCTKCDYETNSQSGLKVHDTKKHTSVDKVKFPKKCDICEKEVKTATDMKKHIKSHSFKLAKFKCDDCDFVGESVITMEVHIGKDHSENYECGLCEFEAKNFENLDIHLNSCEVYQCGGCEKIFKTIKDVKTHVDERQYTDVWHYVYHINWTETIQMK